MVGRLLLAALAVATLGLAQDEGAGGGGGGGGSRNSGGGGGGAPRVVKLSKLEMLSDKLKLNKEQQQELIKIVSAGREESQPLHEVMDKQRSAIASGFLNNKPDAQKKAVDDLTALRTKMVEIEAKAWGKLVATLKPKDAQKAAQSYELFAGVFDLQMTLGRGGSGRGR